MITGGYMLNELQIRISKLDAEIAYAHQNGWEAEVNDLLDERLDLMQRQEMELVTHA